jgi:cell division protein FtsW
MPTRGQTIFLCTLALLVIGVVMVNSAGMVVRPVPQGVAGFDAVAQGGLLDTRTIVTSRSSVYLVIAVFAMGATAMLPVGAIGRRLVPPAHAPAGYAYAGLGLGAAALIALLATVYLPGIGRTVNGSARWVALPVAGSVQPSEFAKWLIVPLMAWYAAAMGGRLGRFMTGLLPAVVAGGAVAAFVVIEDLGTGVLIGAGVSLLLLAAGAKFLHFLMFLPPAALGVFVAILESPYRLERVLSFFNPFADPRGSGYHMIQSMSTVAGGGLAGRGLGHGLQKFGYLPEDTTDFLFAIICEESGIAGAATIIALYILLAWAMVGVIRDQRTPVLRTITVGVLAMLICQAMINLLVVTGLGPTKGIALPMLSSGGTGWVLTAASLGLVIAIDRDARRQRSEAGFEGQFEDDRAGEPRLAPA